MRQICEIVHTARAGLYYVCIFVLVVYLLSVQEQPITARELWHARVMYCNAFGSGSDIAAWVKTDGTHGCAVVTIRRNSSAVVSYGLICVRNRKTLKILYLGVPPPPPPFFLCFFRFFRSQRPMRTYCLTVEFSRFVQQCTRTHGSWIRGSRWPNWLFSRTSQLQPWNHAKNNSFVFFVIWGWRRWCVSDGGVPWKTSPSKWHGMVTPYTFRLSVCVWALLLTVKHSEVLLHFLRSVVI